MEIKEFYAVKALIRKDDKYLSVVSNDFVGGKFEVPGGRKNPGEEDISALRREVREETGLEVGVERELNTWKVEILDKGYLIHGKTYLCRYSSGEVSLSNEQSAYEWKTIQEILKEKIPDWLRKAILKL